MRKNMEIQFNVQVWMDRETDLYVAYVPQLDISSCGETLEVAHKNIQEATKLFLEEEQSRGTLQETLEESGFLFDKEWKAPEILSFQRMKFAL